MALSCPPQPLLPLEKPHPTKTNEEEPWCSPQPRLGGVSSPRGSKASGGPHTVWGCPHPSALRRLSNKFYKCWRTERPLRPVPPPTPVLGRHLPWAGSAGSSPGASLLHRGPLSCTWALCPGWVAGGAWGPGGGQRSAWPPSLAGCLGPPTPVASLLGLSRFSRLI